MKRVIGQEYWADRISEAAIKDCEDHYDQHHVNQIPPCVGAQRDAEWWAVALGIAIVAQGEPE